AMRVLGGPFQRARLLPTEADAHAALVVMMAVLGTDMQAASLRRPRMRLMVEGKPHMHARRSRGDRTPGDHRSLRPVVDDRLRLAGPCDSETLDPEQGEREPMLVRVA